MSSFTHNLKFVRYPSALLGACLLILSGCSSTSSQRSTQETVVVKPARPTMQPVIRADRYTFLSIKPALEQQDLLSQVIDIRIPDSISPTVQDAMTYALRRSGYQLCSGKGDVAKLFTHPLPASHFRLGPIPLREALQLLAGPAWRLEVDEMNRSICFSPRPEYRRPMTVPAQGGR